MSAGATPDALAARLSLLDRPGFVATLGTLYEHSPWVAARAWERRPFDDLRGLHGAMQQTVLDAPPERQLALVRAHPDLGGRLARAGRLLAHSAREQAGLGLDRLGEEEYRRLDRLNAAYRARFGMPFVIAVRGRSRKDVTDALESRLGHDARTEVATALDEIGRIAWSRLCDLSGTGPSQGG